MKPHIKVIQRNGVDIFVTSSMVLKEVKRKSAGEGMPFFVKHVYSGMGPDDVRRHENRYNSMMMRDLVDSCNIAKPPRTAF